MNIAHKQFLVGLIAILATACAHSNERQAREYPAQLCEQAKRGQLDIKSAPSADPHINSYLLDCAVSVVISEVSMQSGAHKGNKTVKDQKKAIADHFLSQPLDLSYRNDDGDNVLMSVITSFLPDPWKEKAVVTLLGKGVDLKETNKNGDTALDIAKFKGNKDIIKLLLP